MKLNIACIEVLLYISMATALPAQYMNAYFTEILFDYSVFQIYRILNVLNICPSISRKINYYNFIIVILQAKVMLPLAANSTTRPIAMAAGFTKVYTTLVELRLKVQ